VDLDDSECCNNAESFNLQLVEFAEVQLLPFRDKCRVPRLQAPRHPRDRQVHLASASLVALRTYVTHNDRPSLPEAFASKLCLSSYC
jgi:hypothetical protein